MKHRRGEAQRRDTSVPAQEDGRGAVRTVNLERPGGTVHDTERSHPPPWQLSSRLVIAVALVVVLAAILVDVGRYYHAGSHGPRSIILPTQPHSYLGLYKRGSTSSYAGVNQFAHAIGRQPNIVSYYSSWNEPFQAGFAAAAVKHDSVPLVQMNPDHVNLAAIAAGRYDAYLSAFAGAVRSFKRPVIVGFGHEMNGSWFSWGYRHTRAAVFVAAWRHIVTLFRTRGAWNVTWLWTINVIDTKFGGVPAPTPWWPGSAYVTWVGIDGYYFKRSWTFAPLFGPTIKAVHALTHDPILIAETGAGKAAGQPAKIADLFAGTKAYGLLGFLWFDADGVHDWRITSPAALDAFRRYARTYQKPGS